MGEVIRDLQFRTWQFDPFVVDAYPADGGGTDLYVWRDEDRDAGYVVRCKDAGQVRKVLAAVAEAGA